MTQNQGHPSEIAAFADAVLALISSGTIGHSPEEYIGPDELAQLQELAKAAGSEILRFKQGVAFTVETVPSRLALRLVANTTHSPLWAAPRLLTGFLIGL